VEDHHLLLHRSGRRAGHPVRDLRPHPQHRLGQRRRRPRHLRVRGGVHPPLVAGTRKPGLPEGITAADHRGRGRPPTATATASGRANWPPWRPRRGFRSRSATSRRAPPSGTRSNTGCSPTSPSTGGAGH
jgi:hypothetical protein